MKKLLLICFSFLCLISFVDAKSNRLYFTEKGPDLVYDTDYFDEKIFMHHTDMYPGKTYEDILDIQNGSDSNCDLFFKVVELEQDELAQELIENIEMEIYVDNELIYDGIATGEDIDGVNLQNTIFLGNFEKGKKSTLVVKTNLSKDYNNSENTDASYIDWEFYGRCASGVILEINPDTGDTMTFKYFVIILVILLLSMILFVYSYKRVKR